MWSNTYQARAVKREKDKSRKTFDLPFSTCRAGTPAFAKATARQAGLISNVRSGTENRERGPGSGVRPNTYSDSIGSAGAKRTPGRSSSAAIQRRGAIQKLTTVNPRAIHSS